jgi:hypothetical protein
MAGVASNLVSCLDAPRYISSPEVPEAFKFYRHPEFPFLLAPLVLYWTGRVWMLASRCQLRDDPVFFAIKGKCSYNVSVCVLLVAPAGALLW